MRIAFLDFGNTEYDPSTVDTTPIGGTESASCYLSRSLARQGHEVCLISRGPATGAREGVLCIPRDQAPSLASIPLDAVICLGAPSEPARLKAALGPGTKLIRWIHLAADQPPVQSLKNPAERALYDGIAMVSQWQREHFQRLSGIDPARSAILRNAIGYPFVGQFKTGESILGQKQWPPVLAYCRRPFRGLVLLLEAFPRIRAAIPGTRLKVFSSLKVYGMTAEKDLETFGAVYQRCRKMEGVEYVGSVPQAELAGEMREVSVLSYPNTFAETSCIVAMEAMASGCRVVTSHHGALPETTAGFAKLVTLRPTLEEFLNDFVAQTIGVLREQSEKPEETETFLQRQVQFINQTATWDVRAQEWVTWLQSLG